jgi:hypothetical protein
MICYECNQEMHDLGISGYHRVWECRNKECKRTDEKQNFGPPDDPGFEPWCKEKEK